MMKLIYIVLLANVLVPANNNGLSKDIEDRRNETTLHKHFMQQWDSFNYEIELYILHTEAK